MSDRRNWSRQELILAINLYCRTPFGRIHTRNPEIIALAEKLGRTPGAVSYKLANFAHLDKSLPRKGAANVSKLDIEVWEMFYNNWEKMISESINLFSETFESNSDFRTECFEKEYSGDYQGFSTTTISKSRLRQNFFRKMILSSYDNKCCITGIDIPELLVASHIIPWAKDEFNRLNPHNGLCMNSLHDRAFDIGLISLRDDFTVMLSTQLKTKHSKFGNLDFLTKCENCKIALPRKFLPDPCFLKYHRENIFM